MTRMLFTILAAFAISAAGPISALAQTAGPATFDSAEAAADKLIEAAGKNDTAALEELFGSSAHRLLSLGDPRRKAQERAQFAQLARNRHHLEADPMNPHEMTLLVGSQDWPFPVPIIEKNGKWSFDASVGATEMQARRIGANELDVIEICAGYVEAQQAYAEKDHDGDGLLEYAQLFESMPGKQDGLRWEGGTGPHLVPKGLVAAAVESGHAKPVPYHGYYFRILKSQGPDSNSGRHNYVVQGSMIGGFALVAWPAQYGVTGVHAFIVNQDGVIYQKNIRVIGTTAPVTTFNPDKSWKPV
ncbi:MAG TPA: DUF2950 domain-containing protein, partial [Bryobacteraceae bacterium]|nr:DUF2950 domain-containing protein [Bryobacteraceae bacterium]